MQRLSRHGGRHELGKNFLRHGPTIDRFLEIVERTEGGILEIGAGDGALTVPLAALGRDLVPIEIDEHRVRALRRRLPETTVRHADAMDVLMTVRHADAMDVLMTAPVIVGNVPFHLTTPLLRRILSSGSWRGAVLHTQWEVARKRAGVGGRTILTAPTDPWFEFSLRGRVPAHAFRPRPSVDEGPLT